MIEGTYGFVDCSVNGFGMGVFTIKGEQFVVSIPAASIIGTAQEQEDGSIVLDVKLNVPPELETAQSKASQGLPHTRHFVTTLPPALARKAARHFIGARQAAVMIRQVRDDFLHPDVRPTLFDTHRLGAASDVYLKGHSGRDDK